MKGSPKVIEMLNEALKEELTAINQYFLHAEMCENWKYDKRARYIRKQSIDEMKHAEELIERFISGRRSEYDRAVADNVRKKRAGAA